MTDHFAKLGFDEPNNIDLHDVPKVMFGPAYESYGGGEDFKGYQSYRSIYHYRRAIEKGDCSMPVESGDIPEHKQWLVEGVITKLVFNPTEAESYFGDPQATDDARTFSTDYSTPRTPFICYIGDQPVCGSFAGSELLAEGYRVRATVCQQQSVTIAKAIECESKGLLWLDYPNGVVVEKRTRCKFFAKWSAIGSAALMSIAGFSVWLGAHTDLL